MNDKEYCVWKKTLDERLKEEKGLEEKIIHDCFLYDFFKPAKFDNELVWCYVCDGFNYNCSMYKASYKVEVH